MKLSTTAATALSLCVLGAFAAGGALAAPSRSASRQGQPGLAAQVKTLSVQVRSLTAEVKSLKKQVANNRNEIAANYAGDACLTAITADAFQGSWLLMDKLDQPVLGTTFFGSPVALDDQGACNAIKVSRQELQSPPTVSVFTSLMKWIAG